MKIYEVIAEDAAYNVGFAAGKVSKLVDKYIIAHNIQGEVVTSRLAKGAGTFLRVIKLLGYYDIAVLLWQQKIAIQGLVKSKQISAEDGDAAIRQQYEKMVASILAAGGVVKLMALLRVLPFVKWFVRAGTAVASGATLGALGGPAIMFAIATEVGIIWLQKYLATKEGQEALAWFVIYIIDPSVVWVWNESFGRIVEAWKLKEVSPEAQAKIDGTIKGKDTAAGIAGKPSAKDDITKSSTSKDYNGGTVEPYDQYGNKSGWGVGDRFARKPGEKLDQGEDYRGPKSAGVK
jgi:hypothetical protein